MADDLTTSHENTWCPGCGNFGLFNALKKAILTLEKKGVPREKLILTTGIGCHGKMSDYLALSGFATLHGRALAVAQGIKLANPELSVFSSVRTAFLSALNRPKFPQPGHQVFSW